MITKRLFLSVVVILLLKLSALVSGQTIQLPFAANYTLTNLGSVTGLPANYGGMTFKQGDTSTLLIGGAANGGSGEFYSVSVVRGTNQHIIGFTNSAAPFCNGVDNDGGLAYGPGGVLFYTLYSDNEIGEILPGSTVVNKLLNLSAQGISSSVGGLNFVPNGFSGAGNLVICSYSAGVFYSANVTSDGTGAYNITNIITGNGGFSGPEGFIYVPAGSPLFTNNSMLVNDYSYGIILACQADTNGMPIFASAQNFLTGLSGAEGAVVDPVTGDFLFSTYGGGNQIVVVQGFGTPLPADLAVTVAANTNSLPCRQLSYENTITNFGPGLATDTFVEDTLSTNAVLLAASVSQGSFNIVSNSILWNAGLLPANSGATMQLTLTYMQPGSMTNLVSVSASQADPNTNNNFASTITTINPIPARTLVLDHGVGGALIICWGANNIGFGLESTTNLHPPQVWQNVTNAVTDNGQVNSVLLTNYTIPANEFFRLIQP